MRQYLKKSMSDKPERDDRVKLQLINFSKYDKLMLRASMWLNLYDHQAVRRKLKKRIKCLFCVFSPFLSLRCTAWQPYRLRHIDALFCFIPMKISNNYRLARMGPNFDDYPGFQLKTTFLYYFAHHCSAYTDKRIRWFKEFLFCDVNVIQQISNFFGESL